MTGATRTRSCFTTHSEAIVGLGFLAEQRGCTDPEKQERLACGGAPDWANTRFERRASVLFILAARSVRKEDPSTVFAHAFIEEREQIARLQLYGSGCGLCPLLETS